MIFYTGAIAALTYAGHYQAIGLPFPQAEKIGEYANNLLKEINKLRNTNQLNGVDPGNLYTALKNILFDFKAKNEQAMNQDLERFVQLIITANKKEGNCFEKLFHHSYINSNLYQLTRKLFSELEAALPTITKPATPQIKTP